MDRAIAVVICDDHTVMAEGLAALLRAEPDIDVVGIGGTVSELLDLACTHRPDVVLLDYQLPDGDGVSAATELKRAHPATRVVMLTAFTSHAVLVAAMDAGCSGYLSKHSAGQLVADGIRRVASGDLLLSPDMLQQLLPRLNRPNRGRGSQLTPRELEILELLATGAPTRAMAASLFVSSNTLRNHVQSILNKLGAHTRLEAVSIAVKEGIIRRA
jgi:DNA-binding NarL/FixJ family response regulator